MIKRIDFYKILVLVYISCINFFPAQSQQDRLMMLQLLQNSRDEKAKDILKSASENINNIPNVNSENNKEKIIQNVIELNSADQSISNNGDKVGIEVIQNGDVPIEKENLDFLDENDKKIELEDVSADNDGKDESEENITEEDSEVSSDNSSAEDSQSKVFDYFGYNFFKGNPEFFQSSISGAVDPDYLVGPGDEIIIMLWGDTELNKSYFVTKDGYLFIQNIGQVYVNGLTLSEVEKKLFEKLKIVYSSLESKNTAASTFFDISLGSVVLKPLRVFILGEVAQPGAYTMKRTASLFSSLFYFNGPTIDGSLRKIQLIRNGKKIATIDYYDYLLTGRKLKDIRLQNDDVVFIPPRGKTVKIYGEVKRQAIYELKNNETLKDLIKIASGLKISAYMDRARVDRIIPPKDRISLGVDRTIIDVSLSEIYSNKKNKFKLFDGDSITVFPILNDVQNIVTIDGSVNRPGSYNFEEGLTITDLILKAAGLSSDAYYEKASVYNINSDLTESQISINLEKAYGNNAEHNLKLNSGDSLHVYSVYDMAQRGNVKILGQVINPGSFPFRSGMTVSDLLFLGGGLKNEDRLANIYLERADLLRQKNKREEKELIPFRLDSALAGNGISDSLLKINDEIYIYSNDEIYGQKEYFIDVQGHMKRPGSYPLAANMTLGDIIFKAGGFDDKKFLSKAYKKRSEILRKNKDENILIPFQLDSVLMNDSKSSIRLKPFDIIRVYSNLEIYGEEDSTVTINGHVKRPGTYPIIKGMKMSDLLFSYGGLQDESFFNNLLKNRADISRIDSTLDRTIRTFNVGKILENRGNLKYDFFIMPGDEITLYSNIIFKPERYVDIDGEIINPGRFVLKNNMNISDLILEAGGLNQNVKAFRVEVARLDKENSFDNFADIIDLKFENNENFYTDPKTAKFLLESYDFVYIRPDPYFVEQKTVSITGEVYYPGDYIISNSNELVTDIINRAGGLNKNAYPLASSLVRGNDTISLSFEKIIKRPRSKSNFTVKNGDRINIGSKSNIIKISGGVNAPGNYQYFRGKDLNDYIKIAGGLNKNASKWATYVTYPDGTSKKVSLLNYSLKIEDGCIINVGLRTEVEPFSFTKYVTDLTSIYADFMQAVLMMRILVDS